MSGWTIRCSCGRAFPVGFALPCRRGEVRGDPDLAGLMVDLVERTPEGDNAVFFLPEKNAAEEAPCFKAADRGAHILRAFRAVSGA